MNKGRKTTKTCIQCLKQVPSARKSCIHCGFMFSIGYNTSDAKDTSLLGSEGSRHTVESRSKRRCREKPRYFDSLEFCTSIKKRKTLVKEQTNVTKSVIEPPNDDNHNQKTNIEAEDKPPSEASISNSTESSESILPNINRDEEVNIRFSTEKAMHYSNILSEINRKLTSISSQPQI